MLYDNVMRVTLSTLVKYCLRRTALVLPAILLVFGLIFSSTSVYAQQPYGGGAYGECSYSLGCDTTQPPPTTVVPVPPSPHNPQPGRAFSVNIKEGQQLKDKHYDIIVTPNFSVDQIKSVDIYANGLLVASSQTAQDGVFVLPWQLPKTGSYNLQVQMILRDGKLIEQQFSVQILNDSPVAGTPQPRQEQASSQKPSRPSWLNRLAMAIPRTAAYAMPYIFFGLLGILLLAMFYQIRNQLVHIKALLALTERDKQLADEKANFIMLSSHYTRTPLTVLAGAIELALMKSPADLALLNAQKMVVGLHQQAENILKSIQSNQDLAEIKQPNISSVRKSLYSSWALILPIGLSVVLVVGMNILFIWAHRINLVIPNIILQIILMSVLAVVLASLLQRQSQQNDEFLRATKQREYEEALDQTRNQFINSAASKLTPKVQQVKASFEQSGELQTNPQIISALGQLEQLLSRFVLVTQLERGKIERSLSSFDIEPVVAQAIAKFNQTITDKQLQVTQRLKGLPLHQSKDLFGYALGTLLDNAVKFSPASGKVRVEAGPNGRNAAAVTIRNQGQPIDPQLLERLFQPFSRSQSAEVANQSGAGLSLYLSRLIMRYLGGDVSLQSDAIKNTTAQLTLPRDASR